MAETRAKTMVKEDVVRETAEALGLRTKKLHWRISWEEFNDRWFKGLCMFCNEIETPDHHLLHKKSGLLMVDCDEDQSPDDKELVEMEVATGESIETEHGKEELIPQFQVPVSSLEHSLRINNASPTDCEDSQCVVGFDGLFGHEEAMLQVSDVQARAVVLKKSESVSNNQVPHQLFDKMPLSIQSKRRHLKCHKSWMFKFKQRKQHRGKPRTAHKLMNRENVMEDYHVYQEGLPLWLLVRFKFWKFKFINRKLQKMMREHGYSSHLKLKSDVGEDDEMFTGAKAVSMRFLLGIMLGITESDAGQGQQAEFEQIVMANEWLLQTSFVSQQVMSNTKLKFSKRWWFKYKEVKEGSRFS